LNIREIPGGVIVSVKAMPGAQKSAICGEYGGALKVKIAAQPEKGKANRELEDLMAEVFGISRSCVEVVAGASSRNKQIFLRGISAKTAEGIIREAQYRKGENING
jgi:uncharacterized protein